MERKVDRPLFENLIKYVAVAMVLFQMYTAITVPLRSFMQGAAHLGFALVILILLTPLKLKDKFQKLGVFIDWLLIIGVVAFNGKLLWIKGEVSPADSFHLSITNYILGIVAVLVILEVVRRRMGLAMPTVVIVFLAYAFVGPYLPGMFAHPGIKLERVVSTLYLTIQGIYGIPLQMSAVDIFSLIAFGGFLFSFGGGAFIIDFAKAIVGHMVGGIAKIAVVASALFGTISGSGPANAASVGVITIPTMMRMGYRPEFAAAVESAASVGGQIMPPVMGAASFIMAVNLGLPYGKIIVIAAIPALLYYGAVFLAVDCESRMRNLKALPKSELPRVTEVFKKNGAQVLLSLIVLTVLLVVFQFSPSYAGFWSIIFLIVASCVQEIFVTHKLNLDELGRKLVEGCIQAAESGAIVGAASAAAGIVLGIVDLSGFAIKLTASLVGLASGSILILLVLTMVASIILGMGLPTAVCYILVAALGVPALVQAGITPIAAHMFAFYFAIMSNLTPPVALTAYVAAGIAKADPIRTGFIGSRLGLMGFAMPFVFVFRPGMLLVGNGGEILYSVAVAVVATAMLVFGMSGYFLHKLSPLERIVFMSSGLALLWPSIIGDILGLIFLILGMFISIRKERLLVAKEGPASEKTVY